MLNVKKLRKDFPIFTHHPELVYLDSTATTLKPQSMIDALREYYEEYSSNVFRGLYPLSAKATEEYEETRAHVADFLAAEDKEIVFTRNTSESLNLIMYGLGKKIIGEGDAIVTTIMEHHSNFVPWQQLAGERKASFGIVGITDDGALDLEDLEKKITKKTKILSLVHVSNVLGTINPIEKIARLVRRKNPDIIIIVDAAQSVQHIPINVKDLGVDFLAFSSHKMLGPTGVGVLWGRKELLRKMDPFLFGGEMIREVGKQKTTFAPIPHKFEAGTPAIGEVIALKAALKYLQQVGLGEIQKHEEAILSYAFEALQSAFGEKIRFLGPTDVKQKGAILAFEFSTYHPHDIADILGGEDVCVRAGHHCAMPLHKQMGVVASTRASFYMYNDTQDVDQLVAALGKVEEILK